MNLKVQWPLVLFSLIAGSGAAVYLFCFLPVALGGAAPSCTVPACAVALALIVVGGLCSVAHLKQLGNSWHVIRNIFSFSGISIELILLGVTFVLCAVNLYLAQAGADALIQRVVAIAGIVFSLLLGFYCGHGYVMPGRPEWETNLLPLGYLGTSLSVGGFLFALVQLAGGASAEESAFIAPWVLAGAAVCAVTCLAYSMRVRTAVFDAESVAISISADIDRSEDRARLGRAKDVFAFGLVGCGVVVTLICGIVALLVPTGVPATAAALVGCVAAVVAGLAVRTLMWTVGRCYLPLFDLSDIGITV